MTSERLPWITEDFSSALIVVAHPDDIEYGAAAAVAKWTTAGKDVSYLLATRGEAGIDDMQPSQAGPVREDEERASAAVVGVHRVDFLDYPDGMVEYGLPLRRDIARAIREVRPELVLTLNYHERFSTGTVNQADHIAVGRATLDAIRDAANRWVFAELMSEGLEPWAGVNALLVANAPEPTHACDVSGHFEAAVASLEEHRQYLAGLGADYPTPRELLGGMLGDLGERQGVEHALAVEVLAL